MGPLLSISRISSPFVPRGSECPARGRVPAAGQRDVDRGRGLGAGEPARQGSPDLDPHTALSSFWISVKNILKKKKKIRAPKARIK